MVHFTSGVTILSTNSLWSHCNLKCVRFFQHSRTGWISLIFSFPFQYFKFAPGVLSQAKLQYQTYWILGQVSVYWSHMHKCSDFHSQTLPTVFALCSFCCVVCHLFWLEKKKKSLNFIFPNLFLDLTNKCINIYLIFWECICEHHFIP